MSALDSGFLLQTIGSKYVPFKKDRVSEEYEECLEIGAFEELSESYCCTVAVPEREIAEWLSPKSSHSFAKTVNDKPPLRVLRLFLSPLSSSKYGSLPFPEHMLREAVDLFHLPESVLYSDELQGPNMCFNLPQHFGNEGFIIRHDKYNQAIAAFCLAMTYHPDTPITCAVLRVLVQADLDYIRARLSALFQYAWHPALLPLILTETRIAQVPEALEKHKSDVMQLEKTAKVYKSPQYGGAEPGSFSHQEERDLDIILGKLFPISTNIPWQRFLCETTLDMLAFVEDLVTRYDGLSSTTRSDSDERCRNAVKAKLTHSRTWASNSLHRCSYVSNRAAALLSTCYSLMAQRDNWLNLRTANTSIDIAELTRNDNLQMKQISLATQRDSTDMRAIAVLTLVFLPATFVATFFSTTFFSFSASGLQVSKLLWVYWIATIGLTVAVVALWLLFSWYIRRKRYKDGLTAPRKKGSLSAKKAA